MRRQGIRWLAVVSTPVSSDLDRHYLVPQGSSSQLACSATRSFTRALYNGPSAHSTTAAPPSVQPRICPSPPSSSLFAPTLSTVYIGSGGSSPALFRPTRIARIPPQLMRLLVAGGAALLQVFLIAFQRESHRLKTETESAGTAEGVGGKRFMSGVEAVQVLGLDRAYPSLFSEVQQAEASGTAARPAATTLLPLAEGKAREEAKRNFDRMFALAVKDDNLFLAGKLSAAYRVCVDPEWDQMEEVGADSGEVPPQDANEGKPQ